MEDVRLLVQEEGRAARNLIAFHVDLKSGPVSGKVLKRKPPSSPRLLNDISMTKCSPTLAKTGSRVRSASTGRDKKSELQARYWAFLFGNLQRAVDEIYQTCESDENVSECKEVILVLENFTRDFHNLIEWFRLKWEYENTPPPQRPTSLAWEVRKSSPNKAVNTIRKDRANRSDKPSPGKRQLNFFSDVKLSSAEEYPKRILTSDQEQLLTNQYGLSFGDINLQEHLMQAPNNGSLSSDVKCLIEIETREVDNKENCPVNGVKPHTEVTSVNQYCQTEATVLQNKVAQKVINSSLAQTLKKAPAPTKVGNVLVKPALALSPVSINKTIPVATRKAVPLSPTNSAPPRIIPGRNVAAATFVPIKKQPAPNQNRISASTNIVKNIFGINKTESTIVQNADKINDKDDLEQKILFDSNKQENILSQISVISETSILKSVEEFEHGKCINLKLVNHDNKEPKTYQLSNKTSILDKKKDCTEKEKLTLVIHDLEPHKPPSVVNHSIVEVNEISKKVKPPASDNFEISKITLADKKPEICDKNIMTDPPQTNKQQPARVGGPIRNKITPPFVRKSNEILSASDTIPSDSQKTLSSNATAFAKGTYSTVRKESSAQDVTNNKPAHCKMTRSNTNIELRTSKLGLNGNVILRNSTHHKTVLTLQKSKSFIGKGEIGLKKHNIPLKSENTLKKKNVIDEDGWETVTGRSRWRLSQSSSNIKACTVPATSRFYLPSPATSLPALTLASEDFEAEVRPAKKYKDKQNQEIAKADRAALKANSPRQQGGTLASAIVNSKLKDVFAGRKFKGISNDKKRMPNLRINNSTTASKRKDDKQTDSAENKIDKLMDILSSEDEQINEEELRKSRELYEEEKMLTKEIHDLEQAEIELDGDTETDDGETDGELTAGTGEVEDTNMRITALKASYESVCHNLSWADQMDTLEKLEQLMAMDITTKGIPFSERITTLEQLEELVARHPGRALELHQKLSSPSRRRPIPDTIQRYHARQANAKQKRDQLLQDKSAKMRELLNKVEEVKMAQAQLVEERKKRLADKLKRAEENRASHLRSIQRKAHDEEEKLREIAFINELEAQNKRHDFMALCQEQRDRLQGILDERQKRLEEKAAKEAAVEERRRILEAERQDKLEKMQERRRKREERIDREQQEKEKERLELAREKARDREGRLQALQAAQLATVEELQKKIQQKQSESARRHEENIEHIRQRALESGVLRAGADDEAPRLTPYDTHKLCRVCNVLIESEVHLLSHLRGKTHQEAVKGRDDTEEVIIDAPPDTMNLKLKQDRERQKALKKRCKKIRYRMAQRGEEYQASVIAAKKLESPNKGRLLKCLKDIDKLQANQGVGQWPNNAITMLERNLAEIVRILEKQHCLDQKVFRELNGFTSLSNILNLALDIPKNMSPYLPPKCFITTCTVYSLACAASQDNSRFVLFTNKIALVLDLLVNRLNALITDNYRTNDKETTMDPVAGALMKLFSLILSHSQCDVINEVPNMTLCLQDIISYTVSVGVVDNLALYCRSVHEPIDNPHAAQFLLSAIHLLTTLAQTKCGLAPTQLVATLRVTELVGAVSMLYCTLLGPPKEETSLSPHTVSVTSATLGLLNAVALLDLDMFQTVLGAEGMSLQLRHIASFLLWYCSHTGEQELLLQVIEVVGFFAVDHYDNQMMLQSGHMPTVLQQLCNLPFEYFSDPALSGQLFPTLLACCHSNAENRAILEQELSYQLLEDFKNSETALNNPLVQLLK